MHDERHLTDSEVAALPIGAGRQHLLEEIMSTPVTDRPVPSPAVHRRWARPLALVATAAAVAAVVVVPSRLASGPDVVGSVLGAPAAEPGEQPAASGPFAVLDAPGWQVDHVDIDAGGEEVRYVRGGADLTVRRSPAESYADYVEDREHISSPPAPGRPVEVLGAPGQLWAYDARDHTVIREVRDDSWFEVRGSGIPEAAFLDLLGELRGTDHAGWEVALPASYVTDAERPDVVADLLNGIGRQVAPAPLLPGGGEPEVDSQQVDTYGLGVDVVTAVACPWFAEYDSAREMSSTQAAERADTAAGVLGTTRRWPVLRDLAAEGDYPDVVWELADDAVAGRSVAGYSQSLGCP